MSQEDYYVFILGCGSLFVALVANFLPALTTYLLTTKKGEPYTVAMLIILCFCEIAALAFGIYGGLR